MLIEATRCRVDLDQVLGINAYSPEGGDAELRQQPAIAAPNKIHARSRYAQSLPNVTHFNFVSFSIIIHLVLVESDSSRFSTGSARL